VHHLIRSASTTRAGIRSLIDVSNYPVETEVQRVVCAKCGSRGNKIDVRPNWKERPGMPTDWQGRPTRID